MKLINCWLNDRQAYVVFGESKSKVFRTHIGLPQGSSLSPYLFIVYHCDLITCLDAHSSHIFADDLNVLITPPIDWKLIPMIKFLEKEGTRICKEIAIYSKRWRQPMNLSKNGGASFPFTSKNTRSRYIYGESKTWNSRRIQWTNKMSLKPTMDKALENIQKRFCKLKWMKSGKALSITLLHRVFFAYSFPYIAGIFPLYPFLPKIQKQSMQRKFRNDLRLIYRCSFCSCNSSYAINYRKSIRRICQKIC